MTPIFPVAESQVYKQLLGHRWLQSHGSHSKELSWLYMTEVLRYTCYHYWSHIKAFYYFWFFRFLLSPKQKQHNHAYFRRYTTTMKLKVSTVGHFKMPLKLRLYANRSHLYKRFISYWILYLQIHTVQHYKSVPCLFSCMLSNRKRKVKEVYCHKKLILHCGYRSKHAEQYWHWQLSLRITPTHSSRSPRDKCLAYTYRTTALIKLSFKQFLSVHLIENENFQPLVPLVEAKE